MSQRLDINEDELRTIASALLVVERAGNFKVIEPELWNKLLDLEKKFKIEKDKEQI